MKLIILLVLAYLAYRSFRSWLVKHEPQERRQRPEPPMNEIDDVMVKDPYCEVYFPKRKGVRAEIDGEEILFCSEKCRNAYQVEKNR